MANTLPNVQLPANTWVDIYLETGIVAGTQIAIENLTYQACQITVAASIPTGDAAGYSLLHGYDAVATENGDTGVYIRCLGSDGLINVRELVV